MAKRCYYGEDKKLPIRDDGRNTCLTDSVARYFNMNPKDVPFFIGKKHWGRSLSAFFRKKGYSIEARIFSWKYLTNKRKLYLVSGLSPRSKVKSRAPIARRRRGLAHAVLYKGREPFFDPADGKFLKGDPLFIWLIKPIKK